MLGLNRNAAHYVWTALFILCLAWLIYKIRDTLFLFTVALLFAYLLWPVVDVLNRWLPGRSKGAGLLLVYLALIGILIVAGYYIGLRIVQDANGLADRFPQLLERFQHPPSPAEARAHSLRAAIEQQFAAHSEEIVAMLPGAALSIVSRASSLVFLVLVPILSFFFLKDGEEVRATILGFFDESPRREAAMRLADDLHVLLAQYMRALVLLGLITAVTYGIFFELIGVPYSALLAAIVFPLEFIPMVGPLAGGTIVLLVAGFSGTDHLLIILVFLVVFRLCQDYVISPQLLSAGMKLHPLMVIFGVLAGASVAGIPGAFLSVPIMAALRIVYQRLSVGTPRTVSP